MLIISFPRSGQHLFERLLKHIYNYYKQKFSYCEFYTCCCRIPCKKKCLFQKNHDFELKLKLEQDEKFFILYRRDKIHQLESFFRYDTIFKKDVYNAYINYNDEEVFTKLINFINSKSKYYNGFVDKYIKSNHYNQSFIVEYNDFLSEPKDYIKRIIIFLNLANVNNIDNDVENIVATFEKIEYKNSLDDEIYNKIHKIIYPQ